MRYLGELRQIKHPTWSQGRTRLAQGLEVKSGVTHVGILGIFLIRRQSLKNID